MQVFSLNQPRRRKGYELGLAMFLAVFCALFLRPPSAGAHTEGIMQLAAEPAGPYMLTVWTSPDPVTTSEPLHVAIAAVLAEDASPVLEADILVRLTPDDGFQAVSQPATIENSENKFLHEAIVEVDRSGSYLVEVFVEGADGGGGNVSFPLAIEGGSGLNWGLIIVAVAVVGAAVILIVRYRRHPEQAVGRSPEAAGDGSPEDEPPAGR